MIVAIFDFDGTLYKNETFPLLMNHLKEHPIYNTRYNKFYRSILAPYLGYKLHIYPERKMKLQMMQRYLRAFHGLSREELDHYFKEIAEEMKGSFNEKVIHKLKKHAEDDMYIMIVSGAFTPLLNHIATNLPVDKIIGTEVPFKNETIDIDENIDHVQAERKTELIRETLSDKDIEWEHSYAYGDSFSDLPVLKMVGNPVAVSPDEKLKEISKENNWETIE